MIKSEVEMMLGDIRIGLHSNHSFEFLEFKVHHGVESVFDLDFLRLFCAIDPLTTIKIPL